MKLRKWYFCLSEASIDRDNHDWRRMILSAVQSCLQNTSLRPILIYDGHSNEFTERLQSMGVSIIPYRVSFYDALRQRDKITPGYLSVASGAFLRVEIPLIEQEDEFVLYTDCDVNFLGDVAPGLEAPNLFALAPQTSKTGYESDANTGVLVLNVPRMREDISEFKKFIVDNLFSGWPGCDQENYRRFYAGRWSNLPLEYNWKPYWGMSGAATIVHWHGPKPGAVKKKLRNPDFGMYRDWEILFSRNIASYSHYLSVWESYLPTRGVETSEEKKVNADVFGHLDVVDPAWVSGWLLSKQNKNEPVIATLEVNENFSVSFECSRFRPDLSRIYGSQVGGFRVELPNGFKRGDDIKLSFSDPSGSPITLGFDGRSASEFSVKLEYTIPSKPLMPSAAIERLGSLLRSSRHYLEYGAGGSTVFASELAVPSVITVESDKEWLEAVRHKVQKLGKSENFNFVHGDIGPTSELGYPRGDKSWRSWPNYPLGAWKLCRREGIIPDLVLVDGRFRLACCLASFLFGTPGTKILFDDYVSRPYYHEVEKFVPLAQTVDRVAEFVVPADLPREDVWLALMTSVADPR